jgi:uncharacterized protein (DUF58 family)
MEVGTPPKWPSARRLAAALAFLGLSSMDRVAVGVLGDRRLRTPHLRGKDGVSRIWAFLTAIEPRGAARPAMLTELDWLRPGMTVVISDFFTEETWTAAVAGLRKRRQEPLLWQLLAPDEENPTLAGDWKLVEAETELTQELTITPGLVAEYLANLARHRSGVRRAAEGAGGRMLASLSSQELEQQMLTGLTAGVITR